MNANSSCALPNQCWTCAGSGFRRQRLVIVQTGTSSSAERFTNHRPKEAGTVGHVHIRFWGVDRRMELVPTLNIDRAFTNENLHVCRELGLVCNCTVIESHFTFDVDLNRPRNVESRTSREE